MDRVVYHESLTENTEYPTGLYPVGVAVTGDGAFVAGAIDNGNGDNVFVYPVGTTQPVRTWDIGNSDANTRLAGIVLAFSPDSSRLFTVASYDEAGHLELVALSNPTSNLSATEVELRRSAASVLYGHGTNLEAQVTGTTVGTVDLVATTSGGNPEQVASKELASGQVTFRVKPKLNTTYSAQLEEGSTYASSTSGGVVVKVRPVLSVAGRPHGLGARLVAKIRPARPGARLGFVVQRKAGGWIAAGKGTAKVGEKGSARFPYIASSPGLYRVRVVYAGDAYYAASKSTWSTFHVRKYVHLPH